MDGSRVQLKARVSQMRLSAVCYFIKSVIETPLAEKRTDVFSGADDEWHVVESYMGKCIKFETLSNEEPRHG